MTFQVDKNTLESRLTGYTFQGEPIVLARRRGRPKKTRAKPGWYPIETKVSAACLYAVTGSLQEASTHTGIPVPHLRSMVTEVWWDDMVRQVRKEENDQITAKMTKIVENSLLSIEDRIANGDHVIHPKTGEIIRVPVKMRDISGHIGVLVDKRNLLRGEATSITERVSQEDMLKNLGDKFEQFAKKLGHKEPELIIDVPFEEIKDDKASGIQSSTS